MSRRFGKNAEKQDDSADELWGNARVEKAAYKPRRGASKFVGSKGGKIAIAGFLLTAIGGASTAVVLTSASPTVTQYYLSKPVLANQMVTMDVVASKEIPTDAVIRPELWLTPSEIDAGQVWAQVDLPAGTTLTRGPLGGYNTLMDLVPAGLQYASITTSYTNGAKGEVRAGYLVDLYIGVDALRKDFYASSTTTLTPNTAVEGQAPNAAGDVVIEEQTTLEEGTAEQMLAQMVIRDVKVVDVESEPTTLAKERKKNDATFGVDDPALKEGIPSIYGLALTPTQAEAVARAALAGGGKDKTFFLVITDDELPLEEFPTPTTEEFDAPQVAPTSNAVAPVSPQATPTSSATPQATPTSSATPQATSTSPGNTPSGSGNTTTPQAPASNAGTPSAPQIPTGVTEAKESPTFGANGAVVQ